MATRGGPTSGFGRFALGFLLGLVVPVAALTVYFKLGKPPVAVADRPFPFEGPLLRHPVNKHIDRELTGPPFGSSEEVFEAGAHIYVAHCARCHGTPGRDAPIAISMYPRPVQLWRRGGFDNVVGVSESETGRTYWKIANGIRLSGMPSYSDILTETEMWQLALLLKHSGDQLPGPVTAILKH